MRHSDKNNLHNTGKRMNGSGKKRKATIVTAGLFAAAFALLAISGVGVARAAGARQSEMKKAQIQLKDMSVSLLENGAVVGTSGWESGQLLTDLIPEGESLKLNTAYEDTLTVVNDGTIDSYVRVVLDLYWLDKNGEKLTALSPELIKLHLVNTDQWIADPDCSYLKGTGEQLILYYAPILPADGGESKAVFDSITIDGAVANAVVQETNDHVITTTYLYDGVSFGMRAEVDAIQGHNAKDAALSAWGVRPGEGSLAALNW